LRSVTRDGRDSRALVTDALPLFGPTEGELGYLDAFDWQPLP
jgi:hypothetical protein